MTSKKMNIINFPKNKIAIGELQEFLNVPDYIDLVEIVYDLTRNGKISPIKNSGLNGKKLLFIKHIVSLRHQRTITHAVTN